MFGLGTLTCPKISFEEPFLVVHCAIQTLDADHCMRTHVKRGQVWSLFWELFQNLKIVFTGRIAKGGDEE